MLSRTPLRSRPMPAEEPRDLLQNPVVMVPKQELTGSIRAQPERSGSLQVWPDTVGSMRAPIQMVNAGSFVAPPAQINSFHSVANLTPNPSFVVPVVRHGQPIAAVDSTPREPTLTTPMTSRRHQNLGPEHNVSPPADAVQGVQTPVMPMNVAGVWRPVGHTPNNIMRTSSSPGASMRTLSYGPSGNIRQASVHRLSSSVANLNGGYSIASAARVAAGYPAQQIQRQPQQALASPQLTSTLRGVPSQATVPFGGSSTVPSPAQCSMRMISFVDARPAVP